jgi:hypothetical protein
VHADPARARFEARRGRIEDAVHDIRSGLDGPAEL